MSLKWAILVIDEIWQPAKSLLNQLPNNYYTKRTGSQGDGI